MRIKGYSTFKEGNGFFHGSGGHSTINHLGKGPEKGIEGRNSFMPATKYVSGQRIIRVQFQGSLGLAFDEFGVFEFGFIVGIIR